MGSQLIFSIFCLLATVYSVHGSRRFNRTDDSRTIFQNPIFDRTWPDSFVHRHHDGFYYMSRSEDNGIHVYKSRSLTNWRDSERNLVYFAPPGLMGLWAPELHWIHGNWYIYFALDDGNNDNHRSYVIMATDPNNPLGTYNREHRMYVPGEDYWAIDGTPLLYGDGQLYFIWSGWPEINSGMPQNLYIAPMCDPMTICGNRVLIAEPVHNWQMHGASLLEGPQIIQHAGRTFVVYSCSGSWTPDYQLGFMGIDNIQNPLDPNNWWRHDQPVFWRNDAESVFGVGDASFTISPDGSESWIVYHAMADPGAGWEGRTARAQKFGWNPDNSPAFPRPVGFGVELETPSGQ